MGITAVNLALPAIALGLLLSWLLLRSSKRVRHRLTRSGLRKRATFISGSLADFCSQREARERPPLIAVGDNEFPDPDTEQRAEDLEAAALYRA